MIHYLWIINTWKFSDDVNELKEQNHEIQSMLRELLEAQQIQKEDLTKIQTRDELEKFEERLGNNNFYQITVKN